MSVIFAWYWSRVRLFLLSLHYEALCKRHIHDYVVGRLVSTFAQWPKPIYVSLFDFLSIVLNLYMLNLFFYSILFFRLTKGNKKKYKTISWQFIVVCQLSIFWEISLFSNTFKRISDQHILTNFEARGVIWKIRT